MSGNDINWLTSIYMTGNDHPRPLGNELAVVIAIAVLILYVIVGGLATHINT